MKKTFLFSIVGLYLMFALFTQGCNTENPITSNPTYDSSILVFNNIIVDEYFNSTSFSGVDLLAGGRVQESDDLHKDIQMRDSGGTSANFYFRSGDMALLDAGFLTKFTPVAYNYTQYQFDTLSKFPYFSNPVDPIVDFTSNETAYFNMPITNPQRVYGFYLRGRFNGGFNSGKKVYGMMYIDSIYQTGGTYKVRIDVKINKAELNQFNPYHE